MAKGAYIYQQIELTTAEWQANETIFPPSVWLFERLENGMFNMKLSDGTHKFSELPAVYQDATISVKQDDEEAYILTISTSKGSFDTPNLRGNNTPTLDEAPGADTLTWTESGSGAVHKFLIGQQCRVPDDEEPTGYRFYQFHGVNKEGIALWAKAGSGIEPNELEENNLQGIYILYYEDDLPRLANPLSWPMLEAEYKRAEGVVLTGQGQTPMVIAIDEAEQTKLGLVGYDMAPDVPRKLTAGDALMDEDGKDNTQSIIDFNTNFANPEYATGYCHNYSARKLMMFTWWLPSCGELMRIMANRKRLNAALSRITGATLIDGKYWSSTQNEEGGFWCIGNVSRPQKTGDEEEEEEGKKKYTYSLYQKARPINRIY